jgi:type II secretory pathway component GspD/PulD (secretin)
MLMHGRQYLLVALASLAALSPPLAFGADGPKGGGAPGAKPPAANRTEALKLKTFTLKRANAEVVRQTLLQVWPHLSANQGAAGAGQQLPLLAAHPRTHTLFVRASQTALDTVTELIGLLEGDSDKDTESLKNLRLVRLRHASSQEVLQILQQLGLQGTVLALPQSNLIVVLKSGTDTQEIEEVIRDVDRPSSSDKSGRKTTGADKKQPRTGPSAPSID